jgi:signal transduction histidine kinase
VPDPEGRSLLVLESARDVTRARQLETQMRHHEKMAALGVLSAGIAHDIRNPLASMSAELEMLEGRDVPDDLRTAFGHLRAQLARMTRTLCEMTDFARRRGEDVGRVPVEAAVDDALRMVQHDPRARRVRIEARVQPDLPPLCLVEDHLVMVLVNLTINSLDAMPEGGALTIGAQARDGGVRITVRDTGVGMPEEIRRRVGEPLFSTKSGRGTGLGLAVCNDVMRSAGGSLSIESAPGAGTSVHLDFPGAEVARG